MLTLITLLSMAVALAAFFAVMLWLDPKRRQYAATTVVAVGAAGLADTVPTVGGTALAQDNDRPPDLIVTAPHCERSGAYMICDGLPMDVWCLQYGNTDAGEDLCMGGYNGSGGGSGSDGSGSGSGSGSGINTIPVCSVSTRPPSPSAPISLPVTCRRVVVEEVVFLIGAACHTAAIAAGAACQLLSRGAGFTCSLSVGAGGNLAGYVGACDSLVEVSRTFISR